MKLSTLTETLRILHPHVELALDRDGKRVLYLRRFWVKPGYRGQGYGSACMLDLCRLADKAGELIHLNTWQTRYSFWEQFDFVLNKGAARRLELMGTMYRVPSKRRLKKDGDLSR